MVKAELVKRSPLRILEKSLQGGVSVGNLGVITSARGVGKTACLVHIATDQLFQGKHVIHVSFSGRIDHIMSWYETIFKEIAKKRNLESAIEIHDDLIKNRVIMNFSQEGASIEQIQRSIKALIGDGQFKADTIVIDGYDFNKGKADFISGLKNFARENKLSIWMTADATDIKGVPAAIQPFSNDISVIITLQDHSDHICLKLIKDHDKEIGSDLNLRLDPKTMLIADSSEND